MELTYLAILVSGVVAATALLGLLGLRGRVLRLEERVERERRWSDKWDSDHDMKIAEIRSGLRALGLEYKPQATMPGEWVKKEETQA